MRLELSTLYASSTAQAQKQLRWLAAQLDSCSWPLPGHLSVWLARGAAAVCDAICKAGGAAAWHKTDGPAATRIAFALLADVYDNRKTWLPPGTCKRVEDAFEPLMPKLLAAAASGLQLGEASAAENACLASLMLCSLRSTSGYSEQVSCVRVISDLQVVIGNAMSMSWCHGARHSHAGSQATRARAVLAQAVLQTASVHVCEQNQRQVWCPQAATAEQVPALLDAIAEAMPSALQGVKSVQRQVLCQQPALLTGSDQQNGLLLPQQDAVVRRCIMLLEATVWLLRCVTARPPSDYASARLLMATLEQLVRQVACRPCSHCERLGAPKFLLTDSAVLDVHLCSKVLCHPQVNTSALF